jgi:DNA (cytosine-5)-methyltransferase 1
MNYKFAYCWNLLDGYPASNIDLHEKKVFGTFICGGGSTMGYKLAGYNHIGGVEIDPEVADVYKTNHNPKHLYIEDIRDFANRKEFLPELYNLDILDGSPPCSSFSMAGNREKDWGKTKIFREGQAEQRLDDLFFDYIKLAKKLQPKIVIAENVKGLIQGNAKSYVHKIKKEFETSNYNVQLFLLNAASMGVPQKRERVFFICQRKDLHLPKLKLEFNEAPILFNNIIENVNYNDLTKNEMYLWNNKIEGDKDFGAINIRLGNKENNFTTKLLYKDNVCYTIKATDNNVLFDIPRKLTKIEACKIGTYPLDYNFKKIQPKYLIGMSVPPVMIAQISHQIYLQWLSQIP